LKIYFLQQFVSLLVWLVSWVVGWLDGWLDSCLDSWLFGRLAVMVGWWLNGLLFKLLVN